MQDGQSMGTGTSRPELLVPRFGGIKAKWSRKGTNELIGQTRSPRRVCPNVKEVPSTKDHGPSAARSAAGAVNLGCEVLVGGTRSQRRVSPNIEEVPNAETPSLPVSTRPSPAGDAAKPGTDLGHEALVNQVRWLAPAVRRGSHRPANQRVARLRLDHA